MQIEAVLFDLFDTLVLLDSEEIYYPQALHKLHGFLIKNGIAVPFEDFSRAYFEVRDKFYSEARTSLTEPHFSVRVSQTLKRFGFKFAVSDPVVAGATMAFSDEFTRFMRLDEEAVTVLDKLYGKYKLGLVSNFAIPECCWKLLEKFGLKKFFEVVMISGEINRRKPSPEIFRRALKALGVEAQRAVFVGDMLDLDVRGPQSVGMKTVFVKRRQINDGLGIKPDKIITRLSELLPVLEDFQ